MLKKSWHIFSHKMKLKLQMAMIGINMFSFMKVSRSFISFMRVPGVLTSFRSPVNVKRASRSITKSVDNNDMSNDLPISRSFGVNDTKYDKNIIDDVVDFEVENEMNNEFAQFDATKTFFSVEYAKSSRAHCKEPTCHQVINKGTIRFAKHYFFNNHKATSFYHPICLLKHLPRMKSKEHALDVAKVITNACLFYLQIYTIQFLNHLCHLFINFPCSSLFFLLLEVEGFLHILVPDQQNLRKLFEGGGNVDPNMYPAVDEPDSDIDKHDWVDGVFKTYE